AVEKALQAEQLAPGLLGVERRLLKCCPDVQPHPAGVGCHVMACDDGASSSGRQQRAEHPHGCGLAGAVWAQEAVDLASRDPQVQMVDGADVAEMPDQPLGSDCV